MGMQQQYAWITSSSSYKFAFCPLSLQHIYPEPDRCSLQVWWAISLLSLRLSYHLLVPSHISHFFLPFLLMSSLHAFAHACLPRVLWSRIWSVNFHWGVGLYFGCPSQGRFLYLRARRPRLGCLWEHPKPTRLSGLRRLGEMPGGFRQLLTWGYPSRRCLKALYCYS